MATVTGVVDSVLEILRDSRSQRYTRSYVLRKVIEAYQQVGRDTMLKRVPDYRIPLSPGYGRYSLPDDFLDVVTLGIIESPNPVLDPTFTGVGSHWSGSGWVFTSDGVKYDQSGTEDLTQTLSIQSPRFEQWNVILDVFSSSEVGTLSVSLGEGESAPQTLYGGETATFTVPSSGGSPVLSFNPTTDATFVISRVTLKKAIRVGNRPLAQMGVRTQPYSSFGCPVYYSFGTVGSQHVLLQPVPDETFEGWDLYIDYVAKFSEIASESDSFDPTFPVEYQEKLYTLAAALCLLGSQQPEELTKMEALQKAYKTDLLYPARRKAVPFSMPRVKGRRF